MKQLLNKNSGNASLDDLMPLIRERIEANQPVRIYPYGKSMLPMLREGRDSVVLSKVQKIKKYDVILYQRENGHYILHRVVKVGDTYTCVGDNQFTLERGVPKDRIIAVCTSFTRKGKTCFPDSMRWRAYAVFWHYSRFPRRVLRAVVRRMDGLIKK